MNFEPEAVRAIADKAMELKTGARALRSIMEHTLLDVMYELPQLKDVESVTITAKVVKGDSKPIIKYKKVSRVPQKPNHKIA